jgi:hypothetical protein
MEVMELSPLSRGSPEEGVREAFKRKLIVELGYPSSLLIIEKELALLPHLCGVSVPKRRLDLLCLEKGSMKPLLLVECKAVSLTRRALDQLIGYNYFVKAKCLVLVNQTEIITLCYDGKEYHLLDKVPSYVDLESQAS